MGNRLNHLRDAAGYSLLEVMVGGLLLGLIALALLPAFFALNNSLKISAFQTSCNSIVRAKLQEYVNGMNITGYSGTPSGFEYTKYRYLNYAGVSETANGHTYYHCQQNPTIGLTNNSATSWYYPGYRENINNNTVIAYNAGDNAANPDVPERLQGFQLYVNVRHYNPRYVGTSASELQPRRQCPAGSTYTTPADYQFFRLGDALEVVVTGMIRTNPAKTAGGRGGSAWGPFKDLNDDTPNPRLVCSATQVIYPPRLPFRYYLGVDGKIRNFQATSTFVAGVPNSSQEAMEAHFRHLWSQDPTLTDATALTKGGSVNIRSISVSPENNRVYLLRPGELKLYYDCTDQTVTVNNTVFPQTPDCALNTGKIITWQIDSNIESITVNYKDVTNSAAAIQTDKVYAILNSGGNAVGEIKLLTLPAAGGAATSGSTGASSTFVVPGSTGVRPRIQGIFLAQTFPATTEPNLFYFDNTCPTLSSGTSLFGYCVSIFNAADNNMTMPVRDMPVQTESISY